MLPNPRLHDLTAELHAAVSDPQRWRAAWQALNEFVGDADRPPARAASVQPPGNTESARCSPGADRRCHPHDGVLRKGAYPVIPVNGASEHGLHTVRCYLQDTYLAALDALPVAAWLCDVNRHLLHANAAGAAELKHPRWFKLDAGQLCASDRALQSRFVTGFAVLVPPEVRPGPTAQTVLHLNDDLVEVGLRRVEQPDRSPFVLVSAAARARPGQAVTAGASGTYWPERRLLSPRQRELAGLLLTFHSLDEAADKMGITRRTARDHLAALFQATGMRRQQDLINFLRQHSPS
ncbi:hypothetical protein LHU53_04690 [Rhodoferax sp. U2-2l]|uniref:helix-turn-helix transcriptional regulator n=1 Tax=Rhodoferax sp. U2-2l TaxID=2884000 RepID=UPI001D0AC2FE|nr:hypothetical protein [Rhodoferax sp. U2-2l]MCB8746199.1 hypothetical protein [Rhodoferax sp. U2-2l]